MRELRYRTIFLGLGQLAQRTKAHGGMILRIGLDIGSTTIKCVVLDEHDTILYSTYERHYSHILEKAQELLRRIDSEQLHGQKALLSISGSAGMGLAME